MDIKTDLHCHTVASTHAFSTVMEIVKEASEKNLEAVAITDHAPGMPDSPHWWHFYCLDELPKELMGVRILTGVELDILDSKGNIDLDECLLKRLDIVVASIHDSIYDDLGQKDATRAYMTALENKYVDILGHSGNPTYRYDIDAVLKRAKELGKFVEINNKTFLARPQNAEICKEIAKRAKKIGVGIVVNSDAHFCVDVGGFDSAKKMLREIEFPEELIVNRNLETLKKALMPRKIIL